jgi:predicted Zn-dependent protease
MVVAWVLSTIGCVSSSGSRSGDAAEHQPTAHQLHRAAISLAERGDFTRAEQYETLAVARGLPMDKALPLLLRVCLGSSRVSAALAHAEPVLRALPDDHEPRYLVATMYLALNRRDDAMTEVQRILRDQPDHMFAARLMAELSEEHQP